MKNILVPIDFSEASVNAVTYAAFLANAFGTSVILVHAYSDHASSGISHFHDNAGNITYQSIEQLKVANEKFLRKEMMGIARKFTVKTQGIVMKGSPVKIIRQVAEKNGSELIVMGMKGKGESNSIFGSTTISMIDKTTVPILVIPETALYQTIETISIASDLKDENLLNHISLPEDFIKKFNPFIQIVNISSTDSDYMGKSVEGNPNAEFLWEKCNHSFNIIEEKDIETGINKFLKKHKSELLVMITQKHRFIEKIFGLSHTKAMTRQTKIPLLVLHN